MHVSLGPAYQLLAISCDGPATPTLIALSLLKYQMPAIPREDGIEINGLNLNYLEWNPDAGSFGTETVILLHGSNGNAHVWDQFGPRIGEHLRTVALDLRGHGKSQWPDPPSYRCEDYASDIEQLIQKLNMESVILVAHSMAVYHSVRFAVSAPAKVSRLVLIDIEAAARDEHVRLLRTGGFKPEPLYKSLDEVFVRERRFYPFVDDAILRAFLATNLKEISAGTAFADRGQSRLSFRYDRATLAQFEPYDEWKRLAQVRCPVLFVYGAHSQTVRPEVMRKMIETVPGSRSVRVDQAAHMLHMENPAGFGDAVVPFCLGLPEK